MFPGAHFGTSTNGPREPFPACLPFGHGFEEPFEQDFCAARWTGLIVAVQAGPPMSHFRLTIALFCQQLFQAFILSLV